jgi:hypothetical protein
MGHNSETPCGLATKHGVSERTSMHSVMDEAACRKLREWRDLSRELVDMGAGDLAAMIEDARLRLAREARRGRS